MKCGDCCLLILRTYVRLLYTRDKGTHFSQSYWILNKLHLQCWRGHGDRRRHQRWQHRGSRNRQLTTHFHRFSQLLEKWLGFVKTLSSGLDKEATTHITTERRRSVHRRPDSRVEPDFRSQPVPNFTKPFGNRKNFEAFPISSEKMVSKSTREGEAEASWLLITHPFYTVLYFELIHMIFSV